MKISQVRSVFPGAVKSVSLLVGSEGGFAPEELEVALIRFFLPRLSLSLFSEMISRLL